MARIKQHPAGLATPTFPSPFKTTLCLWPVTPAFCDAPPFPAVDPAVIFREFPNNDKALFKPLAGESSKEE